MYRIKTECLRARISNYQMKKWWLADRVGVHKTTLRRWLSGRIATIAPERVERLAGLLNAQVHEIAEAL